MATSDSVISAVAESSSVDPLDLEPLYDGMDPEVIDHFVDQSDNIGHLIFLYAGHLVSVSADGNVRVSRCM